MIDGMTGNGATEDRACCAPSRAGGAAPAPAARRLGGSVGHDDAVPVRLPGGRFRMGTDDPDAFAADHEGPVREVDVGPFAVDAHAVSNARFATFVEHTGHVTESERFGWSFVFAKFVPGPLRRQAPRPEATPWWCGVPGASWREPEGPGSSIDDRLDHPVVHVSWHDASAFARWAGRRLPTEAEWEYAARGGLDQKRFPWGDELTPDGEHRCNIWQGRFPISNTLDDGWLGTAPVDAYRPNGFGLYNTSGNVWEWCADRFAPDQAARSMRGGSYLCHDSYCNRYRVAARTSNTPDSASGNTGFRCVTDV